MTADPVPADPRLLAEACALLGDLVAFPTVSSDSNLALIAWAEERLDALGARTRITLSPCGTKANLLASLGPDLPGGVLLAAHTDVVPVAGQDWSFPPFEATRRGGRIHGRGTCDMKGFAACVLALAPRFAAAPLARPLHIALTHDEETGCRGAPLLIEGMAQAGIRPAACLVGEPTGMGTVNGHKGMCEYTTRFTGLAGHGSDPDAGVSAVECAVRFGAKLMELRAALRARVPAGSRFAPPFSTLQIGRLEGGVSHNVIAEHARLDWELRPVCEADRRFVLEEIARFVAADLLPPMRAVHPGAAVETEVIGEVAGLDPAQDCPAAALAARLTGRNGLSLVPFGTEAGLYQKAGIPTVVCGPGSIAQAHTADEWIEVAQLEACLAALGRLLPVLCEG